MYYDNGKDADFNMDEPSGFVSIESAAAHISGGFAFLAVHNWHKAADSFHLAEHYSESADVYLGLLLSEMHLCCTADIPLTRLDTFLFFVESFITKYVLSLTKFYAAFTDK